MEILNQVNSTNDKLTILVKEAEELKLKLQEERDKLNDTTRKHILSAHIYIFLVPSV